MRQYLVLAGFVFANCLWWYGADAQLRRLRRNPLFRLLPAGFIVLQLAYLLWMSFAEVPEWVPAVWPTAVYLWNILFLPLGLLILLVSWLKRARAKFKGTSAGSNTSDSSRVEKSDQLTRRDLLAAAAVSLPPLATLALVPAAHAQIGEFRISRRELQLPQLPADLDGLTIAHVTDLHLGRFMPVEMTGPIIDAINALQCDLVAFTGDLIDVSCPAVSLGIDFIRRIDPRHGLVMIEGNHDVMSSALRFEVAVKEAGLPLLLDESRSFPVPGRRTPVQFLGITWGDLMTGRQLHHYGADRDTFFREYSNAARDASIARVVALRDPSAFSILLAHHPHAFDAADQARIPLVLSGHTHGGQLMLTENIGAGPLRFHYWSGLYQKPNSQLFISNGIGSWFPLRVNAPAEIVQLTLRRSVV